MQKKGREASEKEVGIGIEKGSKYVYNQLEEELMEVRNHLYCKLKA